LNGFKNLVAFSASSGYEFPEAKKFLEAAANAPAAAGPSAGAGTASAAAAPVEDVKQEEDAGDVDMGGLFGDEEDDY
jgi:hypothetical protein